MASIPVTHSRSWRDVHKDSRRVGLLEPGAEQPTHDRIFHDEPSIRRLLGRFDPSRSRSATRPDRPVTSWRGWQPRWASPAR